MKEADSEFEISQVAEAIGLSFEHLGLVVGAFNFSYSHAMGEERETTVPMRGHLVCEFYRQSDSTGPSLVEPAHQMEFCQAPIGAVPETPEFFFEDVGDAEGPVQMQSSIESVSGV